MYIYIRLTYWAMSSTPTRSQLCIATPVSSFVQCQVSFGYCLCQSPRLYILSIEKYESSQFVEQTLYVLVL